jgi:DNA adenine methylase
MNETITVVSENEECDVVGNNNHLVQPFLKWAGGKRQLISKIRPLIPQNYRFYFEPFVGAGALLFELQPQLAIISDANSELINCYKVVKDQPEELIKHACSHPINKKYFYRLRSQDRNEDFNGLSPLERASRVIFLNKTCYNGLFRVNSRGQFNVPFGKYKDPTVVDALVIRAVSRYLNSTNIQILNKDFALAVATARRDDFIYFDPPYDPVSDTSSFTGYNLHSFDRTEQRRLKEVCDDLHNRGCKLLLSNSATGFIRQLYSDRKRYKVVEVNANRSINSVANNRGKVSELLIFNYHVAG